MRSRPAPVAPKAPVSELALREFVRAWGLFHETMRPYFASFGISDAQWSILRTLQRAEDANLAPLRLTDIGARLLVRPPSVTGVVDRLERDGLVLRRPSPDDNRAKRVVLTTRGRALVRRVVRHHPAQIRRILGGLDNGDVREMHRVMTRFAEHLQELGRRDSTGRRGAR